MPSFFRRALSVALLAPIFLWLVWSWPIAFAILIGACTAVGGWELHKLLVRLGWVAPPVMPILAPAVFYLSLDGRLGAALLPLAALTILALLFWLFRPIRPSQAGSSAGAWLAHGIGVLYAGLLPSFLVRLRSGPWDGGAPADVGAGWLLLSILLVWVCDTGAYLAGTTWGKRRLWEAVSPKKSWEGIWGGLTAAILASVLLAGPLKTGLTTIEAAAFGVLTAVVAPLGDLVESRLKREAGVKDSGTLIPGHGGILDRFDSLFFAAPLFYYGLWTFGR